MLNQEGFNSDGTMTVEYRTQLLQEGRSESEIALMEERSRRAAIATLVDQMKREHKRRWFVANQQHKREIWQRQKELGIVPPVVRRVDMSAMTPVQQRAFDMAGLDREELITQGFVDADSMY